MLRRLATAVVASFAVSSSSAASSPPLTSGSSAALSSVEISIDALGSATVNMAASAGSSIPTFLLGGRTPVKRIVNGLWQTSSKGGWGVADEAKAVDAMKRMARAGYDSFDGADHYGNAELLMAQMSPAEFPGTFRATKWCPSPASYSAKDVKAAMDKSLKRMATTKLDLMAFHWWELAMRDELMSTLQHLRAVTDDPSAGKEDGMIKHLGLTNFATAEVKAFVEAGIPIASNQVQYSVIDDRPSILMGPYCASKGIYLFTYGTLLGGFLDEKWLGRGPPTPADGLTVSHRKYLSTLSAWGGKSAWPLFQEMLATLKRIGDKHGGATIGQVAIKYILDKPAVGAVIVGLRAGVSDHAAENAKVFSIALDDADRAAIEKVRAKGNSLLDVIGDCGDEYRG